MSHSRGPTRDDQGASHELLSSRGRSRSRHPSNRPSDRLDVSVLVGGFPIDEPWLDASTVWFDDAEPLERFYLQSLFDEASRSGWWPPAPPVERADDPLLVWWVVATSHVVGRLELAAIAAAQRSIASGPDGRRDRGRHVQIPGSALGVCLDALEAAFFATGPVDEFSFELNRLFIDVAETSSLPAPPAEIEVFLDLGDGPWTEVTYRHLAGYGVYRALDLELTAVRSRRVVRDEVAAVHAWVSCVRLVWAALADLGPSWPPASR